MTDDVVKGVELYGVNTGEFVKGQPTEQLQQWLSLFTENQLGRGLFAVAKHDREVVGFFSLIDIEMLVRGRTLRAGKAEFFVVKEEMRKLLVHETGLPLPWVLYTRLRSEAPRYGYEVILTVPSTAASLFPRLCGDSRLQTTFAVFTLPGKGHGTVGRLRRFADSVLRPRRLAVARARLLKGAGAEDVDDVVEIESVKTTADGIGDDALISSGPEMINFRFPPSGYLKYLVTCSDGLRLLFVFDRPVRRGSVRLVHWSGLPRSFKVFVAVLLNVVDRIRNVDGLELRVELPADELPSSYCLEEVGFARGEPLKDADCYLMDVNGTLQLKDIRHWRVTHGHKGFYGRGA